MKRSLIAICLAGCGTAGAVRPYEHPDVTLVRSIADRYIDYGKVDDVARAAPAMCADVSSIPQPRTSAAADGPHMGKRYFLYASDRAAYLAHGPVKPGFAVVKQAYAPDKHGIDALFVMARVDSKASDAGWIYGTVNREGTVTSAGRVESCMGCHVDAPHGRLFGLRIDQETP